MTMSPPIAPAIIGAALLDLFGLDIVAACVLVELPVVEVATVPMEAPVSVGGANLVELEPEAEGRTWGAVLLAVLQHDLSVFDFKAFSYRR